MGTHALSIDLFWQKNLPLEYLEAAKLGITGALRVLKLDEHVDLYNAGTDEEQGPSDPTVPRIPHLLENATWRKQKLGASLAHLNIDVVMDGLQFRHLANDARMPFLIVHDDYGAPRRSRAPYALGSVADGSRATLSTFRFEREPLAGQRPALFTMMVMRATAQLLGAPNEDRPSSLEHHGRHRDPQNAHCILRRCNDLAEYETQVFPDYRAGVHPFCTTCLFNIHENTDSLLALAK